MATLFYGTAGYSFGDKSPAHPRECGYGYGPTRQSRRAAKRAAEVRPRIPVVNMDQPRVEREMPPERRTIPGWAEVLLVSGQ